MQHADIPVSNITTDFQDGKNICKLVNLLQPGSIAPHQVTEDALSTTSLAIDVASQLGVPRLVEAVDLVESPDALVNMAYFSFFWEKCVEQEEIKETIPEKDEENVTKTVEEKISGEIVEDFEKIVEEVEGKIAEIVLEFSEKVGEKTSEDSHLEDRGPEKVEEFILEQIQEKDKDNDTGPEKVEEIILEQIQEKDKDNDTGPEKVKEIILEQIQEKDKDNDTIPETVDEKTSENVEEQIQDKVVESILENKSPTVSTEASPQNSIRSASAVDSTLSKIEENPEKHVGKSSEKSPSIPRSKTRDSKSSKSTDNSPQVSSKHRTLTKSEKNKGSLPRKSMKSDNVEQSEISKCPQCRRPYQNSSKRTKSANPQERNEEELLRQELEQLKKNLEKQNQHILEQNLAIRNLEITLGKFQNMEINEKKITKNSGKKGFRVRRKGSNNSNITK